MLPAGRNLRTKLGSGNPDMNPSPWIEIRPSGGPAEGSTPRGVRSRRQRDVSGRLVAHEQVVRVAEFPGGSNPYSARLLLRDSARTLGPYLINSRAGSALTGRLPPRAGLKAYLAEARAPATPELLPRDAKAGGWAFRFPAQATAALGALDPREAVAVEFLFPGERTVTAYVEVGDFAAGQAFLRLAAR